MWRRTGSPSAADNQLYADEVIFQRNTRYQRIVITEWKDDLRLFLNSHLQFSSRDEYRYHEALVHPGLSALPWARRALVLGGGDGLAVRELLKYPNLESITLVDLDPEMTRLFTEHPMLAPLNGGSFRNPRVHVINADAFPWLDQNRGVWDFVVVDFPDPDQLFAGQALHHGVLPAAEEARERERADRGAEHLADVFAAIVLVHRRDAETGRIPHLAVSRLRPQLRRMGLHARRAKPGSLRQRLPAGLRFLTVAGVPGAVRFLPRHAAGPGRGESVERSDPGAVLREGMERHRPMTLGTC